MEAEAFQQQVIDRLARIETRAEETNTAIREIRDTRKEDEKCCRECRRETDEKISALEDKVQGLTIKTVVIGVAAGAAGFAGLNLPGWLK